VTASARGCEDGLILPLIQVRPHRHPFDFIALLVLGSRESPREGRFFPPLPQRGDKVLHGRISWRRCAWQKPFFEFSLASLPPSSPPLQDFLLVSVRRCQVSDCGTQRRIFPIHCWEGFSGWPCASMCAGLSGGPTTSLLSF